MKRFKNILAVMEDPSTSYRVMGAAQGLAQRNEARLTVQGHIDVPAAERSVVLSDGTQVSVGGILAEDRKYELDEMLFEAGLPDAQAVVDTGVGFMEVIKRVARDHHDIVFCAPDGEGRKGLAGSSLAMHLLRKCPVPVWVETPRGDESADVAVAVGRFDPDEGHHRDLNDRLVELASSLAASRDGTLHLIHAWRLEGESRLRLGRVRAPAAQVDGLVELAHLEASMNMKRLSEGVAATGVPFEVHLEKGRPGEVIPAVVDRVRPGVLVMGTLARAGFKGMLMGNTAEQILSRVEASVLAVKPDGFESPVAVP